MQTPAMLFVYAGNGEPLDRAQKIVSAEQRVGFVRYKVPKFWPTSGIAELLTVPGAKYNQKTEEWSFSECTPEVWVLAGSPHAAEIVAAYEAVGVTAKVVGSEPSKPEPKPKPARKKRAKRSSKKAAETTEE